VTYVSQDDPRGEGLIIPHTDERLQHFVLRHNFLEEGKEGKWESGRE
jgi:hypothetical protein